MDSTASVPYGTLVQTRACSGHLNTALAQALFHLLMGCSSNETLSSARQQQSTIIHGPGRAPAVPEQGDLHLRNSEKPHAHVKAQL